MPSGGTRGQLGITQGHSNSVTDREILLQSGQKLSFDYLAIATGLQQPLPAKMSSPHKDEACADLRSLRMKIQQAIPCVGATPNTKFLSSFIPSNFSKTTGRILVRQTLQLAGDAHLDTFALGDVAETEGPKMGRTAMAQAELVCENILALIKGTKLRPYKPKAIDGMLKLTLGPEHSVIYVKDGKGADIMVPIKSSNLDLEVAQAWWYLNGDMKAEIVN
ncbi:Fe-regulated protein [Penicillium hordei]|uniref:Fe-regulated protein n=1 Tax=Penicillium hordei TaxID=40994 RepID=A0AAD6EAN8_9EURO|nr:Fe-regulated protein [Penicillium hordei]KAJ5607471.1 Fe-regulated protein [Penicillium hordei]